MTPNPSSVLFVCLGNICRSPLAQGALQAECERRGLDVTVDSAGTGGWHVGDPPDPRAIAVAAENGVDIASQRARQVHPVDFTVFDTILALDANNLATLNAMRPDGATAEVRLLLDCVPGREGEPVADPYYGDGASFETTWADVSAGAAAIADRIESA